MLNLKNVNKVTINSERRKVNSLTNVFVEIKQGDFVCIQGANGSGKSSLLSILSINDADFSGEYFIDGIELSKYTVKQLQELKCSRFGVVPEKCDLLEKRTIAQNLELQLRIANMPKANRKSAIVKAVNSVGLSEKILSLKPTDLSMGQCQRVMIARAIVANPQIIIADNPTVLMDDESTELVLNLFTALNKGGVTIVVVSRDERFLKRAKRVFTMSRGMLVENMKVTRGKNVGEVIDIDAKKKKVAKTSIKKQVIVPEKNAGEIVKEEKLENVNGTQSGNGKVKGENDVEQPVIKDEVSLPKKEKSEVNTVKKTSRTTTSKKKIESDDKQVTFEELVGGDVAKKSGNTEPVVKQKKPRTTSKTKTEEEVETDSELLIKPVKSSRRKTK